MCNLEQSREKLLRTLRGRGFTVVADEAAPTERWHCIVDDGDGSADVQIEVEAHEDGSEAGYRICNRDWTPVQ